MGHVHSLGFSIATTSINVAVAFRYMTINNPIDIQQQGQMFGLIKIAQFVVFLC